MLQSLRPLFQIAPLYLFGIHGKDSTIFLAKDDAAPLNAKTLLDNEISIEKCVASDPDSIFAGLPRVVRPNGVDDTDEIREMVMKAFPELKYFPNQTANRRKLYMAIYRLRTESDRGWIMDGKVDVEGFRNSDQYRPPVLQ